MKGVSLGDGSLIMAPLIVAALLASSGCRDPVRAPAPPGLMVAPLVESPRPPPSTGVSLPQARHDLGMREGFRRCHQRRLQEGEGRMATVVLVATLGRTGVAERVSVRSNDGISASVVSCLQGVISRHTFPPPELPGDEIEIPITLEIDE
jgi:hypothetical protein